MPLSIQEQETEEITQSSVGSFIDDERSASKIEKIWGRLCGQKVECEPQDLNKEKFTAGRGIMNDLVTTFPCIPHKIVVRISKDHFTICRSNCKFSSPVYIKDLSKNGTYLNGELIGQGKQRILQTDDIISVVDPAYKAFVFKDLRPMGDILDVPKEVSSNYYVGKILGFGNYGEVHLVYNRRTCQEFAMKIVKKYALDNYRGSCMCGSEGCSLDVHSSGSRDSVSRLMNEAIIMQSLNNVGVIKMNDVISKPDAVYMIMELMKGGDLETRIHQNKRLTENTTKIYFFQVCQAVKYLHNRGITHRDLKPDNMLLACSSEVTLLKLSDFGLSKCLRTMRTMCGTVFFGAPEIDQANGLKAYTNKVDIWSLGAVLFVCLYGMPCLLNDFEEVLEKTLKLDYPPTQKISSEAKHLMKYMLTKNPSQRPTIDDVLQHNWFKDSKMLNAAARIMKSDEFLEMEGKENHIEPPIKKLKS